MDRRIDSFKNAIQTGMRREEKRRIEASEKNKRIEG
jgi:hypothetical protein